LKYVSYSKLGKEVEEKSHSDELFGTIYFAWISPEKKEMPYEECRRVTKNWSLAGKVPEHSPRSLLGEGEDRFAGI
jgi:hypothetical protein